LPHTFGIIYLNDNRAQTSRRPPQSQWLGVAATGDLAMSPRNRVQIAPWIIALSIFAFQRPCLAPPCGCACGTNDPVCLWNAETTLPCETAEPERKCDCENGYCPNVTFISPQHPKPAALIRSWTDPPGGGCCETGCYGICGDHIEVICTKVFWCQSDLEDWWTCDAEHKCSYHFNHSEYESGYWTEFNPCSYDTQ